MAAQEFTEGTQLALTPDEPSGLGRERGMGIQDVDRRGEARRKTWSDELEEALGRAQSFEPEAPEIHELDAIDYAGCLPRTGGNEHLPAIRGRSHAGRTMDIEADVAIAG